MKHIETLIINNIRKALEYLQREGIGYIDMEESGIFHYKIDDKTIRIEISEV